MQCRICLGETNHRVLFLHRVSTKQEYNEQDAEQYGPHAQFDRNYLIVQCAGCEDVRMCLKTEDQYFGNTHSREYWYPENQIRRMPEWVDSEFCKTVRIFDQPKEEDDLSEFLIDIKKLLVEIYQALGGGSHRLATMGIRALIERIMVREVSDRGTFKKNIEAFFDKGHVAESQQEMFRDTLIEAGHAAMHRGWEPKQSDVITLLDITEALIKSQYVDRVRALEVAKSIPSRAWLPRNKGAVD